MSVISTSGAVVSPAASGAGNEAASSPAHSIHDVVLLMHAPSGIGASYYMDGLIAGRARLHYDWIAMRRYTAAVAAISVILVAILLFVPNATAGKPDLKTYPASDFKDTAYMQKVHQKVGASWKRPEETPKPPAKAVVIVTILRDGSVIESRLHMKSGSDAWDASALDAIKTAAPFDPLPKSYPRTSVEVHFHFEMN